MEYAYYRTRMNGDEKRDHCKKWGNGTPGRIRTYDILFRKQALYPTELRVRRGTMQ